LPIKKGFPLQHRAGELYPIALAWENTIEKKKEHEAEGHNALQPATEGFGTNKDD
jgi:hypothetical protein